MIKHRSGTRWLDDIEVRWCCVRSPPCTRRWGTRVFWFSFKIKVDCFSRFGLKTDGYSSCGFALKPVAWVFRFGPQNWQLWFDNLAHKITVTVSWFGLQNQVGGGLSVCTSKPMSGWRRCEDTHRHPVACFVVKQVGLGFPSLPQKWWRSDDGWCMWYHEGGHVEIKLKTDVSMRWTAVDSSTPTLPFLLYLVIRAA
jgi:hypothetical protein